MILMMRFVVGFFFHTFHECIGLFYLVSGQTKLSLLGLSDDFISFFQWAWVVPMFNYFITFSRSVCLEPPYLVASITQE